MRHFGALGDMTKRAKRSFISNRGSEIDHVDYIDANPDNVPFAAIFAASGESCKSSGNEPRELISVFKVPHRRQIGGLRFRRTWQSRYLDQQRRASGCAISHASGSNAEAAGGECPDNWTTRSRTYANGSTCFALALARTLYRTAAAVPPLLLPQEQVILAAGRRARHGDHTCHAAAVRRNA